MVSRNISSTLCIFYHTALTTNTQRPFPSKENIFQEATTNGIESFESFIYKNPENILIESLQIHQLP